MTDRCDDPPMLVNLPREPLQAFIVRKVEHHTMAASEVNDIDVLRSDVIWPGSIRQQRLIGAVREPFFHGSVSVWPFERARLERRYASPRADKLLLASLGSKHVIGMGKLGQPQTSWMAGILVVADVGDDL